MNLFKKKPEQLKYCKNLLYLDDQKNIKFSDFYNDLEFHIPYMLRTDLISAYDSKELSEALTEHLKDSIKTFFSKLEDSSLADKESCLSIAFNELKKTSNLSYILSSI